MASGVGHEDNHEAPAPDLESAPDESRGRSDGEQRLALAFRAAILAATIGGPFFYLLGRLVADTFFGGLSVAPEEVGISYESLVLPAAALAVLVSAGVLLAALLGRVVAAAGAFLVLALGRWLIFDSDHSLRAVAISLIILASLAALYGVSAMTSGGPKRQVRRMVSLTVVVLLVVLGVAWNQARRAVVEAQTGAATNLSLGPFRIASVAARQVLVSGPDGVPSGLERCVLFLGRSDGITLLLVDGDVWRIPSEAINMTGGVCDPADMLPRRRDLPNGWTMIADRETIEFPGYEAAGPCGEELEETRVDPLIQTVIARDDGSETIFFRAGPSVPGALNGLRRQIEECPRDGGSFRLPDTASWRIASWAEVPVPGGLLAATGNVVEGIAWRQQAVVVTSSGDKTTATQIVTVLTRADITVTIIADASIQPYALGPMVDVVVERLDHDS